MVRVAALYKFARFDDVASIHAKLSSVCAEAGTKGTLLVAHEGINGTIAGSQDGVETVLDTIRMLPGCSALDVKESRADALPFFRMKVRIKREIVTMGQPDIDPLGGTGHYVEPSAWHAMIDDPDTVLIDTRNAYEVAIGSFPGAVDPSTASFSEFPDWVRDHHADLEGKRIAMFCTGGIRCEKATAYLLAQGFDDVHHLKGGILRYLEEVPESESRWQGDCFVFDQRVAVTQGLAPGSHALCHACRMPLSESDRASSLFVEGVSCPKCRDIRDDTQRSGYAERERQMARDPLHLGQR